MGNVDFYTAQKIKKSIYIANIIDHFDTTIYALLVPVIAPLIFIDSSYLSSIAQGYSIFLLGIITRPFGAIYFGKRAQKKPLKTITIIVFGTTIITFFIGIIPLKQNFTYSFLLLVFLKTLQNFFASSEVSIANLITQQLSIEKQRNKNESLLMNSTMIGILIANVVSFFILNSNCPQQLWRVPFLFCSFLGAIVLLMRLKILKSSNNKTFKIPHINRINAKIYDKKAVLSIVPIAGLAYIFYSLSFITLNNLLIKFSNYQYKQTIFSNIILILLDMIVIYFLGSFLKNNIIKNIKNISLVIPFIIFLLFEMFIIFKNNFYFFYIVKICFVIIGVYYSFLLNRFVFEVFQENKYKEIALGNAIGSEIFGRSLTFVMLFIFNTTHSMRFAGSYVVFISILALFGVKALSKYKK